MGAHAAHGLVGREAELTRLGTRLEAAGRGTGLGAVIVGQWQIWDQAVKCVRLIERVYRRAMPLLFEHADLKEALGRRELYWRLVAVSEHMRAIAERVWYAVVKEA